MAYPIRLEFVPNQSKIVRAYLPNRGVWGVKIYIVQSIQKIGDFQGSPYPISFNTNNLEERDTWINQINNVINSGGSIKQHLGIISYTGSMVTEAFMKGEIVDSRVEFEQRDEFLDEKGKLYGVSMIIANDKQVSNLLLFEMQRSDISDIVSEVTTDLSTTPGYRTNTLKYGYEEPEPQVEKDCPIYCDIVYVPTNTVAYSGLCSCSMLENYQSNPDYRIDQISKRETKPDYRDTQPEPEKLYTVHGQVLPLSQSAVDYYEVLGVPVTTAEIDPYVPPTELPFVTKRPESVFQPAEPEVTTSQVEPPAEEEPEIITSQVEPSDLSDTIDTIETSQVEPPGEEEPEIITSQVEPPGQEVTAQISWFGDTWFPWHLELEDRRRR